jgi:hypothetical protein
MSRFSSPPLLHVRIESVKAHDSHDIIVQDDRVCVCMRWRGEKEADHLSPHFPLSLSLVSFSFVLFLLFSAMGDLVHWWLECESDGRITLRGIRHVKDEEDDDEKMSIDSSCAFTVDVARSAQACFDNDITLFDENTQPLAVVEGGEEIKCCRFEPDLCLGLDIMPYFLGWNELYDAVLDTDPTRRQRVLQQAAVQSVTHVAVEQLREKIAEQQRKAQEAAEAEAARRRQEERSGEDLQDETHQGANPNAKYGATPNANQSTNPNGGTVPFLTILCVAASIYLGILGHPASPMLAAVSIAGGIVWWLANVSEHADQAARQRPNTAAESEAFRGHRAQLRQCQADFDDTAIRRRTAAAAGRYRGVDASGEAPEGSETLFSDDEDN